ncbi:MAG: hypothetical protein KDC61_00995 [Saprospiraceae bacterium]|nr:hypothetical protein [Saprospiraceae bacterium]
MREFSGDLGISITPVQLNGDKAGDFWLPMYFTQWFGQSLVTPDARGHDLQIEANRDHDEVRYSPHQPRRLYNPINLENISLVYGRNYEFRVRLADLSGGGPGREDEPVYSAPAPTAICNFKRYIRPKPIEIPNLAKFNDPTAPQDHYQIIRPRLGYPALLFTELGAERAYELLLQDRAEVRAYNEAHQNEEVPNINREYGWFDPDVVAVEITVEVKSLNMDNLESSAARRIRKGAEDAYTLSPAKNKSNFIELYTTVRRFNDVDLTSSQGPRQLGVPLELDIDYIDVPVLRFNQTDDGWINDIFRADATEGRLRLPTARDIRITITPLGKEGDYFGAEWARRGIPLSFDVRAVSQNERNLLVRNPGENLNPADIWRCIYLQSDAYPTSNQTEQQKATGKAEQSPGDMVQRLAKALDLDAKGMSLVARPGHRAIFAAASGIRNTLAPDNSSITFATKSDLAEHWLSVLSFTLHRDWTWDALQLEAFEIERRQKNTRAANWGQWQRVGHIHLSNTININALEDPGPEREFTLLYFIDAVEPKPRRGQFPDTLDLEYRITPAFKVGQEPGNVDSPILLENMTLPVTTPPLQIPKIISAGIALSPYKRNEVYSETEPRQRNLWIEFEHPVENPDDTYFARLLAYAPDPVLTHRYIEDNKPVLLPSGIPVIIPDEPALPVDPEWIRMISPDQAQDSAGLGIMQEMIPAEVPSGERPRHYLLPLPPGLTASSRELFGFFVYEFRVGHKNIWSTARGRFGAELRVTGVQHPAPELSCTTSLGKLKMDVFAPFAVPVHKGRLPNVIRKGNTNVWFLKTRIWCLLYAQAVQADGLDHRNILLDEKPMPLHSPGQNPLTGASMFDPKDPLGHASWNRIEIMGLLRRWGLPLDAPLSVMVVEMLPTKDGGFDRPLSVNLGKERILRTSPLTAVPEVCCEECR